MAHTPGPWFYSSGAIWGDRDECTLLASVNRSGSANPYSRDPYRPPNPKQPVERDANARLIAAAPDLLAALATLIKAASKAGDVLSQCGDTEVDDWETTPAGEAAHALARATGQARAAIAKAEGEGK